MNKYICLCCGAPINRATGRCEYCGTEYDIGQSYPVVRFETFTNPVKQYAASVLVDRELTKMSGEDYMRYSINQLAHAMLPAVMEGMQIRVSDDFRLDKKRIVGTIKMVIPKEQTVGRG